MKYRPVDPRALGRLADQVGTVSFLAQSPSPRLGRKEILTLDTTELKVRAKFLRRRGLYDGVEYHALREELWWRKFMRMEKGRPIEAVGAISDSLDEALARLSPTEQLRFRLNGKWYRENRVPDFYEMCPREEPCLTPRERSERRLQSRIDVLKALDPGRRAIRAQYDEGTRRIMGEHDIPDETWYWHLTLNSLRWRKSSRGQISEGTLHVMTEMSLLSELQASLPISNFALKVHIDNRRESKGAIFTVSRDGTPVVTCMLASSWDDLAYWCAISSLYRSLNAEEVLPNPYRRLATPWLTEVLYPTFNAETAPWLDDFIWRAAGLLIDHLLATPAPESDWLTLPKRMKRLEAIVCQQSGR